jgi:DNA-binding FadR family transcriptional regulator
MWYFRGGMQSTASPFSKVRSTRAHEQIVEQLQSLILSGKLPIGARLPSERAMMSEFDVSRPTVREALRVAESMGLVSVRAGDRGGPKVLGAPSIGIKRVLDSLLQAGHASALELVELRIVLDSSAAALASMQPRQRLKILDDLLVRMQSTTDLHAFADLDVKFHEAVIMAGGNRLFELVFRALDEPIRALVESRLTLSQTQSREETLQHHRAIVEAIRSKDPHQAATAVCRHLYELYFPVLPPHERPRLKYLVQAIEQRDASPRAEPPSRPGPGRAKRVRRTLK